MAEYCNSLPNFYQVSHQKTTMPETKKIKMENKMTSKKENIDTKNVQQKQVTMMQNNLIN